MNFVPTWAKTNAFGTGQGEELLEEQQLRERTFELLASENITCDKTTLFKTICRGFHELPRIFLTSKFAGKNIFLRVKKLSY